MRSGQHQALSQQAAAVIGNQRQLEMKLNRQLGEIEKLQASARQALVLADRQRASGDEAGAQRYEETAQVYASQLVTAEQSVEDLKTLHDQSIQAAGQAKQAVERNSMMLQQKIAERTKLLSQLEQAKMQEQAAASLRQMTSCPRRGTPRRWRRSATRSSGATRTRSGRRSSRRTRCRADARGAAVDDRHGRPEPAGADPARRCAAPRSRARSRRASPPRPSRRRRRPRRTRKATRPVQQPGTN
jgi:phage shock protein A